MNLTFSIKSKKYMFNMFGFCSKFGADSAVAAAYKCLYSYPGIETSVLCRIIEMRTIRQQLCG